jgi:hypothetical protein
LAGWLPEYWNQVEEGVWDGIQITKYVIFFCVVDVVDAETTRKFVLGDVNRKKSWIETFSLSNFPFPETSSLERREGADLPRRAL